MAKRILTTQVTNPTVRLTDKVGSRFVGRYVASRDAGKYRVHEFQAIDGDALITIKDATGGFKEATIDENALVSLFGTKAINDAILQVKAGEVVEFVFNGKKKLKNGQSFNDIAVAILDEVN
jgi:hypothetical protein